jgi:hypothetical protein
MIGSLGCQAPRWRRLKLRPDHTYSGEADLQNVITHLRAALAYLESYRSEELSGGTRLWPFTREKSPSARENTKIIQMPDNERLH